MIKSGMIIALKINADNIALEGVARFMIFKTWICGIASINIAGIIVHWNKNYWLNHCSVTAHDWSLMLKGEVMRKIFKELKTPFLVTVVFTVICGLF